MRSLVLLLCLSSSACIIAGSKKHFYSDGIGRASFDMSCPEKQMVVTEIRNSEMGVEGCGTKSVYAYDGTSWAVQGDEAGAETAESTDESATEPAAAPAAADDGTTAAPTEEAAPESPAEDTGATAATADAPQDDLIVKLRAYKEKACACDNAECFGVVAKEMQAEFQTAPQPAESQMQELQGIIEAIGQCAVAVGFEG